MNKKMIVVLVVSLLIIILASIAYAGLFDRYFSRGTSKINCGKNEVLVQGKCIKLEARRPGEPTFTTREPAVPPNLCRSGFDCSSGKYCRILSGFTTGTCVNSVITPSCIEGAYSNAMEIYVNSPHQQAIKLKEGIPNTGVCNAPNYVEVQYLLIYNETRTNSTGDDTHIFTFSARGIYLDQAFNYVHVFEVEEFREYPVYAHYFNFTIHDVNNVIASAYIIERGASSRIPLISGDYLKIFGFGVSHPYK